MESITYTIDGKEFELKHYGVKGMKWGRRKARPEATDTNGRGSKSTGDQSDTEAQKKARRKIALKVGAAVVGTALAVYGAKKLHAVVRDKNYQYRMEQGSKAIDAYIKRTSQLYSPSEDWRVRMARDDRDAKYFEQVYKSASRQADNDSFGRAVRNVMGEYLLKEEDRVSIPRASISRAKVGRASW